MTCNLDIPFDRVTYRNGQRLDARDMRDDHRRDQRLRWLHVLHLHHTWGIALGFEPMQLNAKRVPVDSGGTALVIGPGYAVDECGRDLLLPESVKPPLPAVDGRFVLTIAYREDREFRESLTSSASCSADPLGPLRERVGFAWRTPEEVRFGPEVPLVQLTMASGAIAGALDLRVRRYTQRLARPHIDARVTEEGRSGWRDWIEGPDNAKVQLGLQLDVDTSEAGFIGTPFYFAALQGDFSNGGDKPLFEPDLWPTGEVTFTTDSLGFITAATATSFTYRLFNFERDPFLRQVTAAEAERRRWRVAWFGLESANGCEPARDFSRIFTLAGFHFALNALVASRGDV